MSEEHRVPVELSARDIENAIDNLQGHCLCVQVMNSLGRPSIEQLTKRLICVAGNALRRDSKNAQQKIFAAVAQCVERKRQRYASGVPDEVDKLRTHIVSLTDSEWESYQAIADVAGAGAGASMQLAPATGLGGVICVFAQDIN